MTSLAATRDRSATQRYRQTLREARAGVLEAQYQLGLMLANGAGVNADLPEALRWMHQAASRGHGQAQLMLGTRLGAAGVRDDDPDANAQAMEWLLKAWQQGQHRAGWRLAQRLERQAAPLALAWHNRAAAAGVAESRLALAQAALAQPEPHDAAAGKLTPAEQAALDQAHAAALQGLPAAQTFWGELLLEGRWLPRDVGTGRQWLEAAAAQGWPSAWVALEWLDPSQTTGPQARLKGARPSLADPHDARARYHLGMVLELGLGGHTRDLQAARRWYALAATQDWPAAHTALGRLAEPQDTARALTHYGAGARHGDPDAQWALARLGPRPQKQGAPQPGQPTHLDPTAPHVTAPADELDALSWQWQAARAGQADALLACAALLQPPRSRAQAQQRDHLVQQALQRAAESGLPQAQFALGEYWSQAPIGWPGMPAGKAIADPKPYDKAATSQARHTAEAGNGSPTDKAADAATPANDDWLPGATRDRLARAAAAYRAAAASGHAAALGAWAAALRDGLGIAVDLPRAREALAQAAESGDARARWNLALWHAAGLGDSPRNLSEAERLCRAAAEDGFVPAQATLGVLLNALARHEEAVHWWRRAAMQGDPEAQVNLSVALTEGLGTPADPEAACDWLLQAAEGGLVAAQSRLALRYAQGEGVPQDPLEAHKWFFLARLGGDDAATQNLALSRERLSPALSREAERRARAWLARHPHAPGNTA